VLDHWHPAGILLEKYGHQVMMFSRVDAKLSTALTNGGSCWRPARSDALVDVQSRLSEVNIGDCDRPIWSISKKGSYVSANTWNSLRTKKPEVEWWSPDRFPHAIPRQAFLLWLVMRNRPTTGDWLVKWGFQGDI